MKKILALTLSLLLIISTCSVVVFAEGTTEDGTLVEFTGVSGTGTAEEPYLINSLAELKWFRDDVNSGNDYSGKYVKLTADINLNSENWTPIGYQGKTFKGTFDGGDNTISNLYCVTAFGNTSANNGIGFFGRTDSPAVIKNLTIENATVLGSLHVGAVVGSGYTGKAVENVTVKGEIKIDAWWYAGVIGGNGYMSLVNNCHVIAEDGSYVKGNDGSYIGGIWGFRGEGNNKITNCTVTNLDIIGVDRVGGICGIGHYGNTVADCAVSDVTVTATDSDATTVGLIVGACQGTDSSPTNFDNNTAEDVTVTVGDEVINAPIYGTNINGSTAVTNYVATVGGNAYADLQAAIDAAQNGETVTLLNDVALTDGIVIGVDDVITLNLNGKTVSRNTDTAISSAAITNNGNLTIVDSTLSGGKVTAFAANPDTAAVPYYANNTITNCGVLTIKGGTIENSTGDEARAAFPIDNNSTVRDAILNVEGGTISGRGAIRQFANSNVNKNEVNITGGTVNGTSYGIWMQNPGSGDPVASLSVSGGKVDKILLSPSANFEPAISGGTVSEVAIWNASGNADRDPSGFITGGTFNTAVDEAYCADGFVPVDNGDGTYGVTVTPPSATVEDIDLGTLDASNAPWLTFAKKFIADAVDSVVEGVYGDWYADFVLTINKDVTFNAGDENSDGYLAGQYDAWSENWVSVPFEDVTLNANEPLKIMEYAASLMGQSGLKLTYRDVYNFVKEFDCGVYFTPEFLAENPDLEVKLELRVFNPENEEVSIVIHEQETFKSGVATVNGYSYATFEEAIAAANTIEEAEIVLLQDVTVDSFVTINKGTNVTIDLNGHAITGTDTTEKNFGLIQNNGTLTVKDSVGGGKISLTATVNSGWNRYSAVVSNNPGGKLTVNAGTIEHLGGTDMAYGIDSLTNGGIGDASVTINGGKVVSKYCAIRQFLNSDSKQNVLRINGGTIESTENGTAIFFHDSSKKANNGTITIGENAEINGNVYLFVTEGSTEWPVEVSIAAAALKDGSQVTTKNIPAGYAVENTDGIYGVVEEMEDPYKVFYIIDMIPETDANGDTYYRVGFGAGIDSLNYSAVGFDVVAENGVALELKTTQVYDLFYIYNIDGTLNMEVQPSKLGGNYIFYQELLFPASYDNMIITFRPFYVTLSGEKISFNKSYDIPDFYTSTVKEA